MFDLQLTIYGFRSHIPTNRDREVQEFRKLEREKSFDEARSAVQSQIEKMFQLKAQTSNEMQNQRTKHHQQQKSHPSRFVNKKNQFSKS